MEYKILNEAPEWWDEYVEWMAQAKYIEINNPRRRYFIIGNKGLAFSLIKKMGRKCAFVPYPNNDKEVLLEFKKYCRENGLMLLIYSFDNLDFLNFSKDSIATVVINLKEDIWSKLRRDQKRRIKKNIDLLEIREAKDRADWDEFYKILMNSGKEKNFHVPEKSDFESLYKRGELGFNKLFLALKDKKIISGDLISIFKKQIKLPISATLDEYYEYNPTSILMLKIIEYGKNNGFEHFDLGGYDLKATSKSPTFGINEFKRGFGEVKEYKLYCSSKLYIILRKIYAKLFK